MKTSIKEKLGSKDLQLDNYMQNFFQNRSSNLQQYCKDLEPKIIVQ